MKRIIFTSLFVVMALECYAIKELVYETCHNDRISIHYGSSRVLAPMLPV